MDLGEKQLTESVFAGGGDMGARMRAFDWSTTDLGPVAQWPQSLRAGVRIVLAAGHPMLISWGPDYTMLYNDAYGVVVGTKHPGALGRSCREVLAEAWDFIGPRFDSRDAAALPSANRDKPTSYASRRSNRLALEAARQGDIMDASPRCVGADGSS